MGNLESQAGETTAPTRKQCCLHRPKPTAPCDPAQVSPSLSHETQPQCAHCQYDLFKTEVQSTCRVSGSAAFAEHMGKTRKTTAPTPLREPGVTGGICPVPVSPALESCTMEQKHTDRHGGFAYEVNEDWSCIPAVLFRSQASRRVGKILRTFPSKSSSEKNPEMSHGK